MKKNKLGGKEQFIALLCEHPELDVVTMVDAEVCGDDYGTWAGSIGGAHIDSIYMDDKNEVCHFESDDFDSLVENRIDKLMADDKENTPAHLLFERANMEIRELPWEKVIVLCITTI